MNTDLLDRARLDPAVYRLPVPLFVLAVGGRLLGGAVPVSGCDLGLRFVSEQAARTVRDKYAM